MDNNVIGKLESKVNKTIIEIKVPFTGTAPPASSLISDAYIFIFKFVEAIEIFESVFNKFSDFFFLCEIILSCFRDTRAPAVNPFEMHKLIGNPFGSFIYKSFDQFFAYPLWSRDANTAIGMDRETKGAGAGRTF